MKLTIRKKVFLLTIILSIALITVSISISSIIFSHKTKNESLNLCKSSAESMGKEIECDYQNFIVKYKQKIDQVYRENREEIEKMSLSSDLDQKSSYFNQITENIFPPRSGLGLSYEMATFNNDYNDIIQFIDLIVSSQGMICGFVVYYDAENSNIVYLIDSLTPSSANYNHPCSIEKVDEKLKSAVFEKSESVAVFEGDVFSGYYPIRGESGEILAFIGFNYSVEKIVESQRDFLITLLSIMLIVSVITLIFALIFADRYLVRNIRKLSNATIEFTSHLSDKRELKTVATNISSKDEIGVLSDNFNTLQNKIIEYVNDLSEKTAVEEHMRAELNIASKIQMQSLPGTALERGDFRISSFIKPAKEVGGDLFDYFMPDKNKLFFVIADVSGKGVPAALFMMKGNEILKSCASGGMTVRQIAETANSELCKNNSEGLFISAFIGIYEIDSGKLTFVRAGHEQPYLLRNGKAEKIGEKSNFVLGGIEDMPFDEESITLCDGDKILMYTDGVNEGINESKEEFGYDRIKETLEKSKSDVMQLIYREICDFSGEKEQFDDITMLLFELSKSEKYSVSSPKYDDIPSITEKINSFVSGMDKDKISELDIIIDEMMNNYISYAFENTEDPQIDIIVSLLGPKVNLTFIDNGILFDPLKSAPADTDSDLETRAIGGLGIMLVKNLSDDIKYAVNNGKNELSIRKTMI